MIKAAATGDKMLSSKLLTAFEKAASDPAAWIKICDSLAKEFNGIGTALIPLDKGLRFPFIVSSSSLEKVSSEYIKGSWYKTDIRERGYRFLFEKGWTTDLEFVSENEMESLPYYRDFLKKFGLGGFVAILFSANNLKWVASVQFPLDKISPTQSDLDKIPEVAKQLQSASDALLDQNKQIWNGISQGHNLLDRAILVLNSEGELLDSNPLGKQLLEKEIRLTSNTQRTKMDVRKTLSLNLDGLSKKIVETNFFHSYSAIEEVRFTWTSTSGQVFAGSANIIPASMRMFNFLGPIIVILRPTKTLDTMAMNVFSNEFGLTKTEQKIASRLLQGESVKQISKKKNITEGNVRQHMKKIFRKSEVTSQHQLVSKTFLRLLEE